MKKLIICLIGMATLTLSGCANFLDEENKSATTADAYYATTAGYETLINSCYSTLRDVYGGDTEIFTAGTDLFTAGRGKLTDGSNGLDTYADLLPNNTSVENFYKTVYQSIARCNDAIHYGTGKSAQRVAEARFLRAFYYFHLVQQFGDVALDTTFIDYPAKSFERTPAKDIYNAIISDMKSALDNLPAAGATPDGRVNKRVVNHFLSLVYLTRGYKSYAESDDFANAKAYATTAINGQGLTLKFIGTGTNATTKGVFWPGNEKNTEVLFSVQYSSASLSAATNGNSQAFYYGAYLGGPESNNASMDGSPYMNTKLQPTAKLYALLSADPSDTRFGDTFMQSVLGNGSALSFYSFFATAPLASKVMFYYPNPGVAFDEAAWRAADPTNRTATVIKPAGTNYANWADLAGLDKQFPCIKKFSDPSSKASFSTKSSTRDIFLARLAETYLIRAEAEFKLGDATNMSAAAADINVVRARSNATAITSADVTINYILDERARELAGEYQRWEDLARTGTLTTRVPGNNPRVATDAVMKGNDGNYKLLRPIPQNAIAANQATVAQNPGY